MCLAVEHFLETSSCQLSQNTYQKTSRKWQTHNPADMTTSSQHQLLDTPNWTAATVSPRARTTFLTEHEQPPAPQNRMYTNQNFTRTRPTQWEPDCWNQRPPNGHWNDRPSNRNSWQENYPRNWDEKRFTTSIPHRTEEFSSGNTNQQPQQTFQRTRLPETSPKQPQSKIRDPRLLSGRVNSTTININSPLPPSVYVPISRRPDDELETPRSPSPEQTIPVVPPVIIGDASITQEHDDTLQEEMKKVFSCEHCSYIGKKIIPHHVNRHPGKEVPVCMSKEELVSAMSTEEIDETEKKNISQPEVSFIEDLSWIPDKSIFQRPIDCKICGYSTVVKSNLIQHLISHRKSDSSHLPTLYCRFCDYCVNLIADFRDHVTTHTGEFDYTCGYCAFKGYSTKSVRSHVSSEHMGKPAFVKRVVGVDKNETTNGLLPGFVCQECRFVQLTKETVAEHVKKHGVSKDARIIEINMARLSKNRKNDTEVQFSKEIVEKPPEIIEKPPESGEKVNEPASEMENECLKSENEEEDAESEENSEDEGSESDKSSEPRSNSPPHLEPEQDNTMSCEENEDALLSLFGEDGGKIAPSIAETISRLQATLRKGVKRSSLPPPILEPMDGKTAKLKEEIVNITENSGYAFKCGAKGCGFFCGEESLFLQHSESSHAPREAPCTECGGCFAQWKLLLAHIRSECEANDKLPQYACGFASCEYATNNDQFFFTHTRTVHKKEFQLPCCYCEKNFTLVTGLVRHLKEGCRAATLVKSKKAVKVAPIEEKKKVESENEENETENEIVDATEKVSVKFVYKCPNCDHKTLERDVFRSHVIASHSDSVLSCSMCLKELGDADAVIEHIESEHGDERIAVSMKRLLLEAGYESPKKKVCVESKKEDEIRDPAVECLALKSPFALATMLNEEKLQHLFKCMGRSCLFTASRQEEFAKHLSESKSECISRTVCCYCMQDCAGVSDLVDHVIKQHGHCTYQCKYCFYRTISDEYVNQHQRKRHAALNAGNLLCQKDPLARELVNEPVSADLILPFKCALSDCQYEVADPYEFRQHNEKGHDDVSSFPCHICGITCDTTDGLLTHYKSHGYNNYQCGFCLYGSETEEEMLFHLCSIHSNRKGQLIVRSPVNNKFLSSPTKHTADQSPIKSEKSSQPQRDFTKLKENELELKIGHALFQCGYPPCSYSSSTTEMLREHMVTCLSACLHTSSICPHCQRQWKTMTLFLDHLVNQHGGQRFICGRCPFRGPSVDYVQSHMKLQHGIPPEQTKCKLRDPNSDPETGEYTVQEHLNAPPPTTPSKLTQGRSSEKRMMVTRKGTTFGVEDINRLPMQSIFPREVCCAICGYATKVRSNLIRHLQLHKRQLDTDEPKEENKSPTKSPRKKDKSKVVETPPDNAQENKILPQLIANTSLYRCAVQGCDYLALDNTMYKCHVTTLHPDVSVFPCPHCGDKTNSLDRLLIHFRLHGPRLYKCSQCSYVSYRRHQVETHLNTTHESRFLPVLTIRDTVAEEDPSAEPEVKSPRKKDPRLLIPQTTENGRVAGKNDSDPSNVWCCAICTHPGPTKSIIKNHLQTSHGVRSEFKCGICSCVSNAFESVRLHFVSRHPDSEVKIMPLIVKAKDYDPNNLYISAPKESTTGSSSSGNNVAKNTPVLPTSKPSMAVTRRASLSAAAAAANAAAAASSELESVTTCKVDGGSSKDIEEPVAEFNDVPSPKELVIDEKIEEPQDVATPSVEKMMFVCPVCHEYRTKFRGDMRIHIYRELQYRRVQCLRCNSLFVSEKEAKHHSLKTHQGVDISLRKNEVPETEIWVKEQLDSQVRAWGSVPRGMHKGSKGTKVVLSPQEDVQEQSTSFESSKMDVSTVVSTPDVGTNVAEEEDGESAQRHFRYYCTQCCYQCEGTTDLRKHIFRHLKFKPFQCTYCLLRFSEKQQIRNHHNLFHVDNEFICQRQPNLEPERFVDELLHQQRMEWKDKKKNAMPGSAKAQKTAAQLAVTKMAEESAKTVTSDSGSDLKVYACRHDGCNFTCDQLKGLKVHLMAHLRQARFRCGYCTMTGSSQYQVRRHCLSIHAGKKVLVVAIYDRKNDAFISTTPPPPTPATPTPQEVTSTPAATPSRAGLRQHCCPYCSYSHSLPKMISRHLMRHYVEKPFQCGHCKRTGIEKFDILYHCKKVHPELEPKVIETPLPSNPEIKPILRRGHCSTANQDIEKVNQEDMTPMVEETMPLEVQVTEPEQVFECNECQSSFQAVEQLQTHLKEFHKEKKPSGEEISKDKTKSTSGNRSSLLKCIYCDLASDSLKLLRKHCHESHTGNEVRLRKLAVDWEPSGESILRCGYCGFAVTQMSSLWNHHVTDHAEKCVKFRIAVRKSAALPVQKPKPSCTSSQHVLWCSYCNDPCDSIEQMVKHWKMFHGHLELKYKTPTGEEGIISKEITDGVLAEEEEKPSENQPPPVVETDESRVKMYGCAQCKYESDKYDMVRQHLFRHLQRFSCPKCGKMYPFEYELRKHVEVHHPGIVLDSVKNPEYDDQEKEELIRNIRVWFTGKEIVVPIVEIPEKRKQVARKSLRGMSQVSSAPKLNVKARKSSSCRLQTANLLQETLSKNLPGVEQMQHQIISDLVKLLPMNYQEDFGCSAKKLKRDKNRVSLSLDDLYRMSPLWLSRDAPMLEFVDIIIALHFYLMFARGTPAGVFRI
uniref:C2H2-type domain-containing protein n=1 Tax=Strigamia maritima TaxID=126957 RepID=T1IN12_STRMM